MPARALSLLGLLGFTVLLAATLGASCSESERATTTPRPVHRPAPSLRLLVVTDLQGYLEPCGCTSHPLGGIDRMAARVAALRQGVPTAMVAAGDLFFSGDRHGDVAGAETQEHWKAETLVGILNDLDLAAATVGKLDFDQGSEMFAGLAAEADFPILAAGCAWGPTGSREQQSLQTEEELGDEASGGGGSDDQPHPPFESRTLFDLGETKLGLFGVSDLSGPSGRLPESVGQSVPPFEASVSQAQALRAAGADVVVALVVGDRRLARRVATTARGIDFVIQGGLDEADAIPPSRAGSATIVHAGRQGQGLLVLDLFRRGEGSFTDWSEWSVEVERTRLQARIDNLGGRIAEWETSGEVDAADLERQKVRLRRFESEHASLHVAPSLEGNAFDAEWIPLEPDAERALAVTRAMTAYDRRVNRHNRELFADLRPDSVDDGEPHYAGSEACQSCHETEFSWWRSHAHGRAYATLVERDKQFNLSCVGCHVTGYMKPGGSTVTHNLDGALVDVGCESCHGPSSAHVGAPDAPNLVVRETPESLCVTCHNPEHSDRFVYQGYMAAIVVPGHGLPLRADPPE